MLQMKQLMQQHLFVHRIGAFSALCRICLVLGGAVRLRPCRKGQHRTQDAAYERARQIADLHNAAKLQIMCVRDLLDAREAFPLHRPSAAQKLPQAYIGKHVFRREKNHAGGIQHKEPAAHCRRDRLDKRQGEIDLCKAEISAPCLEHLNRDLPVNEHIASMIACREQQHQREHAPNGKLPLRRQFVLKQRFEQEQKRGDAGGGQGLQ